MFLPGDGSLLLESDRWPSFFGQHWPRQPVHVQGEAVNPPQKGIRGHLASFQHAQEIIDES